LTGDDSWDFQGEEVKIACDMPLSPVGAENERLHLAPKLAFAAVG